MLLLHGNTSSANAFARILKASALTKRRVVAIDLPGYGNSDDVEAFLADLWIGQAGGATFNGTARTACP